MDWIEHVRESLHRALSAAYGLDPASNDALKKIIPAYIETATNTQAPRNVDLCYFSVSSESDTDLDYIQTSVKYVKGNPIGVLSKTIPVNVLLTFYGPHADGDSERIWSALLWDQDQTSPRAVLRKRKIVFRGKPKRPVSLYEVEGTYQRRRCDIQLELAYLEETERALTTIIASPDIIVVHD